MVSSHAVNLKIGVGAGNFLDIMYHQFAKSLICRKNNIEFSEMERSADEEGEAILFKSRNEARFEFRIVHQLGCFSGCLRSAKNCLSSFEQTLSALQKTFNTVKTKDIASYCEESGVCCCADLTIFSYSYKLESDISMTPV
jgi:hypothetical protein